jgi:glycine/serine hydroxymethyltransferase
VVVDLLDKVMMDIDSEKVIEEVRNDVQSLMNGFRLYPDL